MSATSGNSRQHLHAATAGGQDPTQTKTVRRRYAQRLRGAYGRINARIREGIEERDVLGLRGDELAAAVDPVPDFTFETDDRKIEAFDQWLQEAQEGEVLDVIDRSDNRYVRRAYERGLEDAGRNARRAGIAVPDETVGASIQVPVHEDALQLLYTRNFQELQGITAAVDQQVSRTLAEGVAAGEGPRDIARSITDRVNKIGKTRSTVLARTEVIHAHSEASLNRFEQLGVDEVSAKVEFQTAGDTRVCPICETLEGRTYSIDQARGVLPIHPMCRCAWLPVGGSK